MREVTDRCCKSFKISFSTRMCSFQLEKTEDMIKIKKKKKKKRDTKTKNKKTDVVNTREKKK